MGYGVEFCGVTHIGLRRLENQDNMVCNGCVVKKDNAASEIVYGKTDVKSNAVFGVFDGLGGAQRGGEASMLAAQMAERIDAKKDSVRALFDYCIEANKDICSYRQANNLMNIGTTAAVVLFGSQEIALCNLGDTKVFRISNNTMEQISKDHIVQLSDGSRYLTQNLGVDYSSMDLTPYIARGRYKKGDQYLICSDGLTDMVDQQEILRIVRESPFDDVVALLLSAALANGGRDNVTIIMCKVLHRLFS